MLRDAVEKCFEADVGWHGRHIFADEHHAKAAVGAVVVNVQRGFAGAAVDDGGKVWGDDDAVLTCCRGVFSCDVSFDDFHAVWAILNLNGGFCHHKGGRGCRVGPCG